MELLLMAVGALISLVAFAIEQGRADAGARGDKKMKGLHNLYSKLENLQSRYKSGQLRGTEELTKVYNANQQLFTDLGADIQWYNGIMDGYARETASNTLTHKYKNSKSVDEMKRDYQNAQMKDEYKNTLRTLKQWKDSKVTGDNLYEKENITQKV